MATLQPAHYEQDACHTAQGDRLVVAGMVCAPGVSFTPAAADNGGADSLAVTPAGGLQISVDRGLAYVLGTPQASRGIYTVTNLTPTTLGVSPADATDPRVDLVVAQVRDSQYGEAAAGSSDWRLFVVTGTPAPTPPDPAVPDSSLVLARITVPAGASALTPSNIEDLRKPFRRCGLEASARTWTMAGRSSVPTNEGGTVWHGSPLTINDWPVGVPVLVDVVGGIACSKGPAVGFTYGSATLRVSFDGGSTWLSSEQRFWEAAAVPTNGEVPVALSRAGTPTGPILVEVGTRRDDNESGAFNFNSRAATVRLWPQ